ncbi:MAG: PKD domain-containing protein [Arachnia sp.]
MRATSLGSISAVDGTSYPFGANQVIHNYGDTAAMISMKVVDDKAYSAAYWFGGTGNFEGGLIADAYDGTILNLANCLGDTYDMAPMNGLAYMVSHHHQCTDIGGFTETSPKRSQHTDAITIEPAGKVQRQTYGYPNFEGQPAGSYVNWFPVMWNGTASGSNQAGWTVEAAGDYLLVGGEFPVINDVGQQGLARFTTRSNGALKKIGPSATESSITPTLRNIDEARTRVRWQSDFDRDGMDVTYNVQRRVKNTTPISIVQSITGQSTFFRRPGMQIIDETVVAGTMYQYRLHVVDADGNPRYTPWVDITAGTDIVASGVYSNQVFADGADHYWRLNESTGSEQITDWAGADDLTTSASGVSFGIDGAIIGTADTAANFIGNNLVKARGSKTTSMPERYSSELWFRTTTNRGGKLLGFGNGGIGNSSKFDRHVYMRNDGRLTYGVYSNSYAVTSSNALNDGQWHHVVATLAEDSIVLHVDGLRVGRTAVPLSGTPYAGRWHLGGDNLSGWAGRPSSDFFSGDIDDVAIYSNPLTQEQIRDHYTKSGRTVSLPEPPSDVYGMKVVTDEPLLYWRLGEPNGATAARDSSINSFDGTYRNGPTLGQPSEVTSGNLAASFDGSDDFVSSNLAFTNPTVFSLESWVKTTTTTGGKIIGFGSAQTGNSSSYDRHVYMNASGQLRFGAYTGVTNVAGSSESYNDGEWHHVVATFGPTGMALYVDGVLVATNPNTGAQNYTGYWRVGGDNSWEDARYFDGVIDEVAVYDYVLSAAETLAHYNASSVVENQPPVAVFMESTSGLSVVFDSAGSSDGDALTYAWAFGDGESSSEASPTHTYAAAGTYTVSLTVSDGSGGTDEVSKDVTVSPENQAPVAAFSGSVSGLSVVFDSAGSSDPDGDALTYAWAFGDGESSSEASPTHTYAAAGTYTVSLTVSDGSGGTDEVSKDVTVSPENQAPVAAFSGSVSGLSVVFDSAGSSDPDGDALSYAWAFGDGGSSTEANPSHTYAAAGTYTVSLTVSDGEGGTDEFTKDVTVSDTAIAGDTFGRTVASGWGSADVGGVWTVNSGSTMSVDGSSGVLRFPWAVSTRTAYLNSVLASDVSIVTDVALDQVPVGGKYYHRLLARVSGSSYYMMTVRVEPSGAVWVYVSKFVSGSETVLRTTVLSDFDYAAGEELKIRFEVVGDESVNLSGKVWRSGEAEPASATVSATDSSSTLPAGGLGLKMYAGGGMSSLPLIVKTSDYQAEPR